MGPARIQFSRHCKSKYTSRRDEDRNLRDKKKIKRILNNGVDEEDINSNPGALQAGTMPPMFLRAEEAAAERKDSGS